SDGANVNPECWQVLSVRTAFWTIGAFVETGGRFAETVVRYLPGSTERLALTGRCRGLNRIQHAMPRDRVVERGAEMRSLAIVASETRVRLGDVGGRARTLRRRPPILLGHE